ncbi:hypothetical protein B0H66DRAFT_546478 [Apodospora peruviana]|uniref:Uncharacterized protein n=1 Tax=Apodospora peruviana TaxID=516989 RepID=A0AAE0MG75_9PEZI|nr:hypothetical protein B0H66DRAFT_546478 [Apodospora peruviana]
MAPFATYTMIQTTATVTSKREISGGLSGGGAGVNAQGGAKQERTVEQVEAFAAEVTGNHPPDDVGNRFHVTWSLKENDAQPKGIVRQLKACILLTRKTEETFTLVPTIEVEPDFKTRVITLFSSRPEDDPVIFDPAFEPYDTLSLNVDRWNLGAVSLGEIWDCTFHHSFGDAVKESSKEGAKPPSIPQ